MNGLIENIKNKFWKVKNKLRQSFNGDRGKEGRLLVSLICNKDNDALLLSSLFPPLGFNDLTHACKKIFSLMVTTICTHDIFL
jgi:hypothetical protein